MTKAQDSLLAQCDYTDQWAIPKKTPNTGDRRGWVHRFSWDTLKKENVKFHLSIKKEVQFPVVFMKNSWNIHGSWFLTLEIPSTRVFTQFWRICRGKSLFFKSKVTNPKILGVFFQKSIYRGQKKGKSFD